MRVFILGKGLMLANIILGVKDAGAEIAGVFRYESTCNSKLKMFFKDFFEPAPEVTLIKKFKLNEARLKSANEELFRKLLINLNVDLVIVGTWKEKISPETFNIPTIATVNVHPSLLPKYRGPNPYIQTILHNEEFSGLTIHIMTKDYDQGPILKQKKIKIYPTDTSKELRDRTVREARTLVKELIQDFDEKMITPVNQDEKYATYYPHISGDEKMLDFSYQTAEEVSRTIRALTPFLPCYITYKDKFFIVNPYNYEILPIKYAHKGEIVAKNPETSSLTIVCKDNRAIKFTDLKLYKSPKTKQFIANEVKIVR